MFAQSQAWCGGFCKRHAHSLSEPSRTTSARRSLGVGKKLTRRIPRLRLRSKQTVRPLRRSSPSREGARAQCPDCLGAGVAMFAQSAAWCGGFCKRHARAHGLSEPSRTTSARRSPCVDEELTRRIPRVRLGSKQAARPFRLYARCQQAPCPLRQQSGFEGKRFCRFHATWQRRFADFKKWMFGHDYVPPSVRTRLGRWQCRQIAFAKIHHSHNFKLHHLTTSQLALLRTVPNWDVRRRRALEEFGRNLDIEGKERLAMSVNDVDSCVAAFQGLVLQRDREVLSMWREDYDAAKLCDEADVNEEHVDYHDYTDSLINFGVHRGKTFGAVFKEYPAYARWANRQLVFNIVPMSNRIVRVIRPLHPSSLSRCQRVCISKNARQAANL